MRSTGQFQSRLKAANGELDALREKHKADSKQLKDLTLEKALLNTKVKDRDEELRGKAKLLEVASTCALGSACAKLTTGGPG